MDAPTVEDLAAYCGHATPPSGAAFADCLAMAIEYVQTYTGPLEERESNVDIARRAILIIAKHEWTVQTGISTRGALGGNPEQVTPGPGGYLIPNRAKTLMDALRWDNPASIGIG